MRAEGLEASLLCPTVGTGLVNVLAKNACNHGGYAMLVFVKRNEFWWQTQDRVRFSKKCMKQTTRSSTR